MITKPNSLFNIVQEFLTSHLVSIESLDNIPELVGEQLFKRAVKNKAFQHYERSERCLQLFLSAYKGTVLSSVCLRDSLRLINEYTDPIVGLCKHVVHLDLSYCHLGDDHEIILALSQLADLKTLKLRDVNLSDAGMRKLTLPTRMFGKGPVNLQTLILSDNGGITDKSLHSLSCFCMLSTVDLSNTNATRGRVVALGQKLGLHLSSAPYRCQVKNEGWAVPILSQWQEQMEEAATQRKRKRQLDSPTKTGLFSYKKRVCLWQLSPRKSPGSESGSLVLRDVPDPHIPIPPSTAARKLF